MARTKKPATKNGGKKRSKQVEALSHAKTAARRNIPTAELASAAERMEETDPVAPVRYPRAYPLSAGVVRERD
jgi:adenine-specific DNA-methyltransferase